MPDQPDPGAQFLERKLATILSADVAEFSRLMGEDEEQTLRTFRGHKQVFESLVAMHRGRIFNTAGDAILAEFASAVEAVRCATDIQAALRTRNDQLPLSRQVRFRIGINLGDVMLHGQDLLGDGVNVAARLQTAAEPGGICISGSVHDQISNKLSLSFRSLGEMNFKNIQQPIRTFSITEAAGMGALPSPQPRGAASRWGKWLALAVLLLAAGYWSYTVKERIKADSVRPNATAQPDLKPQPDHATTLHPGPFDGVYAGPICYGETPNERERCYPAEGIVSGTKITSEWTMGHAKKVNMRLAGHVTRSGDVQVEIEMRSGADGSRLSTIDLSGAVNAGLINLKGSFRKGRPATLSWRKKPGAALQQ